MDKSERYIKMCEKAEEIQLYFIEPFIITNDIHSYWVGHIWLPRQDQLQEMVKCVELPILCQVFEMFTTKRYEGTESTTAFIFTSMEQLWLAFVMKEKYDKVWAGDSWKATTN